MVIRSHEDGSINIPDSFMTNEEVETFRKLHYKAFRKADWESVVQFELIANGQFDQNQIDVKNRWPEPQDNSK